MTPPPPPPPPPKYSFRNITRVANTLNPDQNRCSVGPDLGPNCLRCYQQMTKIDVMIVERVNFAPHKCYLFRCLYLTSYQQLRIHEERATALDLIRQTRSRGMNPQPLVYKVSGLSTTSQ